MGIIAEEWTGDAGVQVSVQRASGIDRLRGLIARRRPAPGSALLIPRCNAVHGVGMTCALDVVFLDADFCVLRVDTLRPFGLLRWHAASHTLELRPGEAERLGLVAGARLRPPLGTTEQGGDR